MDLGFFTMPLHPLSRNYPDTLDEDRQAIILADQLGFTEAFVGEHVTDLSEPISSSLMFLASLAHETRQIKLGSGTVNLPNNHPVAVAAQVALLDNMLRGRFLFGIGPGGLKSDSEAFGNLEEDRTAMFVEAIDHILAMWQDEPPIVRDGKYWNIRMDRTFVRELGKGMMLRPYQNRIPESGGRSASQDGELRGAPGHANYPDAVSGPLAQGGRRRNQGSRPGGDGLPG